MLVESGRVVAIEPDAVWVETLRRSTCGACEVRNGCGHGLLNRIGDGRRACLRVLPGPGGTHACEVNDEVRSLLQITAEDLGDASRRRRCGAVGRVARG